MSISELEVYKKLEILKLQGDLDAGELLLISWAQATGKFADNWQAFSILFSFALNEGRIDKAREYSARLVEMDESDAHAHSCLGQVYALYEDYQGAAYEARVALDLAKNSQDPSVLSYTIDLGNILLQQEALDECEALLSDANASTEEESSDPLTLAKWYWLIARFYHKKRMHSQSIDYYRMTTRTLQLQRKPVLCYQLLLKEMVSALLESERTQM